MRIEQKKFLIFVSLGVVLLALLLLAIGLPQFELQGGEPFPFGGDFTVGTPGGTIVLPGGNVFFWIFRGFLALMIITLPIYVIISLFSPEGRRRLFANLVIIVVLIIALSLVSKIEVKPQEVQLEQGPLQSQEFPEFESGESTPPQFQAQTPAWLVWVTSIGVGLFFTGLFVLVGWLVYKRNQPKTGSLDRLASEAQRAASALQEGGDFKNTIIRCYFQMSKILYEERGIQREAAMTPHEFQQALETKGLPAEPIQYLTQVFEDVRYGNQQPTKRDEEKAIWFLSVIAESCRRSRPGSLS